jgi:hypothetical protein
MPTPDRFFEDALALAQRFAIESARRRRYRRRHAHGQRRVRRVLRGIALISVFTFVLLPTLVAALFFVSPYGFVGLLAAPLVLVVAWALILRWTLHKPLPRPAPVRLPSADLAALSAETEAWIEQERRLLPWAAQSQLDHITQKLMELAPQLKGLSAESPAATSATRLIGEELPLLVQSYRKLPKTVLQEPFYDGPSPEQKLIDGLGIIAVELARMQARLARDDLHALAAHGRYLELKYKDPGSAD